MIFDTHTHYDDDAFDEDRDSLLKGLREQGIAAVANMGASMDGIVKSLELAKRYPFVYAAVGIHPDYVGELDEEQLKRIGEMSEYEKVVAIGEIGLDYYWDTNDHDTQKYWFGRQLGLAMEKRLPVAIHSRDAAADTLAVMKEYYKKSQGTLSGVIHCFSYAPELAREYLDMGFFLGIGGVATFKNSRKLKEVIEMTPLNSIVLETDCPYLAPEPYRGKRNSSDKLRYVVSVIAEIKDIPEQEVEDATWENAKRLYPRAARAEHAAEADAELR